MVSYKNLLRPLMIGLGMISLIAAISSFATAAEKSAPETFVQIRHTSSINTVVLSPDGQWLLSGSGDDSINLWEVASGRLIRTFKDTEDVEFVAFQPGGRSFFSLTDDGQIMMLRRKVKGESAK
jgi:WD40 repeat protein